ncbi:hypothetical protein VUR80DRAFT_128 [Thermomyces stellatus]
MTISNMQLTVRKATLSDAKSIAKIGAHVFAATFGHSVSDADLQSYLASAYTPEAVAKDISDPDKKMIVATDDAGAVRGFVAVGRGGDEEEECLGGLEGTGELHRLYVDVSAHGKGVGTLLVKSIEQIAREFGVKNMWLGVWEENYRAIRAYERWGYRTVGDHDFRLGTVVQRDFIMTKAL